MEKEHELERIDLSRYIGGFLKMLRWTLVPILMIAVLCGLKQYRQSYQNYTPYYQASALLTVQTGQAEGDIFNNNTIICF